MAAPVPMDQLFSNEYVIPVRNGVVEVTVYPDGPQIAAMLILCLGCFISETIHLAISRETKLRLPERFIGFPFIDDRLTCAVTPRCITVMMHFDESFLVPDLLFCRDFHV
jgi:hypothetical protein